MTRRRNRRVIGNGRGGVRLYVGGEPVARGFVSRVEGHVVWVALYYVPDYYYVDEVSGRAIPAPWWDRP